MSDNSPKYTLGETVDGYLLRTGNIRRKHFAQYFQMAQDVYKDIYRTIMPSTISKYVQVFQPEAGDKNPFILKPDNLDRFIGVSITNKNNDLIDVIYNEDANVFTKPPIVKSCGCVTTDLCDCIDNLQVVITEKMVVDGVTYYEKVWVKCCSNGDVLQYSETPVLNGNCSKWMLSGSILGPATFSYTDCNGTVVTDRVIDDTGLEVCISNESRITMGVNGVKNRISDCATGVIIHKSFKNLGRLAIKDCGCPLDTDANKDLIFNKCGCHLGLKPTCCTIWYKKERINCTGEMKWSECGQKLYLIGVKDDNGFAVIHYQPTIGCEEVLIDDAARKPIRFGIDYESSVFNPRMNPNMIREKERRYTKAKTEFWEWLHPLNEKRFFTIPTSWISW